MQSLSQIGNARREERVLLPALIELRSEYGDEALTADGVDVSPSGLSVRAAFVPEVGTRLSLSFRCPPHDDAVHALGEVVWSSWEGAHVGSFGMRFLELDTKSATAIRRLVAPGAPSPHSSVALPRAASMRIDGLGAPIEADVRLYDRTCIVLEQELAFLRLGRGIEVDLPGRGMERGRIASIELRQGPLDTPTLVFGILLDEQREQAGAPHSEGPRAQQAAAPPRAHAGDQLELSLAARVATAEERRRADEPQLVRAPAGAPNAHSETESERELERALQRRLPEVLVALGALLGAGLAWLRHKLLPALSAARGKLRAAFAASPGELSLTARLLLSVARMRAALAARLKGVFKRVRKRRTTTPVARVQRPLASARVQRNDAVQTPARGRRWATVSLAAFGVGLGVYALAPRSGADRIRIPRAEPAEVAPEAPLASLPEPRPTVEAVPAALLSTSAEAAAAGATPAPTASSLEQPGQTLDGARFGEANVPNGRVFVLRMSGPVRSLEGEGREDGFSVRIPGRLALDRASPIATSHRAVARALILNRGEYAELTVEFLPGMRPKYQVAAKDSSIEITLERL